MYAMTWSALCRSDAGIKVEQRIRPDQVNVRDLVDQRALVLHRRDPVQFRLERRDPFAFAAFSSMHDPYKSPIF